MSNENISRGFDEIAMKRTPNKKELLNTFFNNMQSSGAVRNYMVSVEDMFGLECARANWIDATGEEYAVSCMA